MDEFNLGELQRLLANLIRIGTIAELDEGNKKVKVKMAGLTTGWLDWGSQRAGKTRKTSMPSVGEQVVVFSPFGDTAQAVVGFSLNQDAHPAVSDSKDIEATEYPDGTRVEYNSETNTYTMTMAGDAKVVINCKEATVNADTSVTINTPEATCTGNLTVQGQLTYQQGMSGTGGATINGDFAAQGGAFTHNSKNVGSDHTHTGVQPGGGTTGSPT